MNKQVVDRDSDDNVSVVLPLRKKDLGNFISNLLGQQQSISREVTSRFDIDHAWLVNLHELLQQRIKQQADSTLIDFVALIHFESGLKRTITTADSFKAYAETKKDDVVAVTLLWSYLVKFPGRPFPDKQEISFHARVRREERYRLESKKNFFVSFIIGSIHSESDSSFITYEVSHTERTWGDDIESLLSNQVDQVTRHEGGITETVYNFLRWSLAIAVFVLLLAFPIYYTSTNVSKVILDLNAQYQSIDTSSTSIDTLNKKLDITNSMIKAIGVKDRGAYLALIVFLAPFLSAFLLKISNRAIHSFIVLSNHDKLRREKLIKGEKNSAKLMIASYFLAILAGILGNYGYAWLTAVPTDKQITHIVENTP